MIDQAYEISAAKDNGGLPHRLVVAVSKKKDIVTRLEIK